MNETVASVLEELDGHRARFEAFCRSLSDEQLGRPVPKSTWQVKDFISHLATIDGPIGEMFRTVREGGDPGIRNADGSRWEVDDWNEIQVRERRLRPLEEVLAEAAEARAALLGQLTRLGDKELATTMKFAGDSKRPPGEIPLGMFIRGWAKHDPMHALDMSRAVPEAVTAELTAWWDDPVVAGYQSAMNKG